MIFTKHAFERLAWRSSLTTDRVIELIGNDELHRVVGKDRSGELHTLFYDIVDNEMYVMIHENNEVITVMTYVQHQGQSRFVIDQEVVDGLRKTATHWHKHGESLKLTADRLKEIAATEKAVPKLPSWKLKCQILDDDTHNLKILNLGSVTAKNANSIAAADLAKRFSHHLVKTPNSHLLDIWSCMGSQMQRSTTLQEVASRAFIDAKRAILKRMHKESVNTDAVENIVAFKNVSQKEIDEMIFDKFEERDW